MAVGIVLILTTIFNGMHNYTFEALSKKISGNLRFDFHKKVSEINSIFYEDSGFLDELKRADEGIEEAANLIISITFFATFYLLYFVCLGVYFYLIYPMLLWAFVLILIPALLSQVIKSSYYEKYVDKTLNINRKYKYYFNCIADKMHFKETRVLNASDFFFHKFDVNIRESTSKLWKIEKKMAFVESVMKALSICGYGAVFVLLIFSLKENHISIGACSTIFISVRQIYELLNELFGRQIGTMLQNRVNIKYYLKIMNRENTKINRISESRDVLISAKNINFLYPNTSKPAIHNLSIKIKPREVVAIVGYNGSGKTTLAKLLCGIYNPDSGEIREGKHEIKSISAVFQNFAQYMLSVKDNVLISDLNSERAVAKKLDSVDFNYAALEGGVDTLLGREFGGTDLSGGQWQRLAIARGIYREYNFIILDEPNSAIDPFEEERLYEQFAEIVRGKAALLITHRLNSVKIADRIVVMDKGEIIEEGTHEVLLKKNGKYKKMFDAQKMWYIREAE